jgi:hypothetical protein
MGLPQSGLVSLRFGDISLISYLNDGIFGVVTLAGDDI